MNFRKLTPYFSLLRPKLWVKNVFVLFPLLFSQEWHQSEKLLFAAVAFFLFILASSSTYVLNDLLDAPFDRLHPDKKHRPIASRKILPENAFVLWIVLLIITVFGSFFVSWHFLVVVLMYLFLSIAYSLYFKRIIFLDVMFVALGFVFRLLAGGIATSIMVTDWIIVLTFLFTMFIALSKRRQELQSLEGHSSRTRSVLSCYTIDLIDQLNGIVVPIVIMSYIVYTFSQRNNNPFFIATIPLVMYAFFRYLYLLKKTDFASASEDHLGDAQLLILWGLWMVLVMIGLGGL